MKKSEHYEWYKQTHDTSAAGRGLFVLVLYLAAVVGVIGLVGWLIIRLCF
jgi:flagellar biogenesis protein FliO